MLLLSVTMLMVAGIASCGRSAVIDRVITAVKQKSSLIFRQFFGVRPSLSLMNERLFLAQSPNNANRWSNQHLFFLYSRFFPRGIKR